MSNVVSYEKHIKWGLTYILGKLLSNLTLNIQCTLIDLIKISSFIQYFLKQVLFQLCMPMFKQNDFWYNVSLNEIPIYESVIVCTGYTKLSVRCHPMISSLFILNEIHNLAPHFTWLNVNKGHVSLSKLTDELGANCMLYSLITSLFHLYIVWCKGFISILVNLCTGKHNNRVNYHRR